MVSKAEKAVVTVVAYSAQFDHPLTPEEVCQRLLTGRGLAVIDQGLARSRVVSGSFQHRVAGIRQTLDKLVRDEVCVKQGQWYTLSGSERAFEKRALSQEVQREKESTVTSFVALTKRVPWVLGVALTGSHAVGGARPEDDLDFLVVTQAHRLWLARLWLLVVSWRQGRRLQLPGGDISHSWDLNLWLADTRLALPPHKQTIYEAYEMLQTRWVLDKQDVRARFFTANPWAKTWLVHWPPPVQKSSTPTSLRHGPPSPSLFFDSILNGLDWLAFLLQIGYRTLRHGRQKANKHSAFFHQPQTRSGILQTWKKLYHTTVGS